MSFEEEEVEALKIRRVNQRGKSLRAVTEVPLSNKSKLGFTKITS
jgi:hypothetical protein